MKDERNMKNERKRKEDGTLKKDEKSDERSK